MDLTYQDYYLKIYKDMVDSDLKRYNNMRIYEFYRKKISSKINY